MNHYGKIYADFFFQISNFVNLIYFYIILFIIKHYINLGTIQKEKKISRYFVIFVTYSLEHVQDNLGFIK